MRKNRIGLQKGLAEILEGVSMPQEARGSRSPTGDTPTQTARHPRLDRTPLFDELATRQGEMPIWFTLRAKKQLLHQIRANQEHKQTTEQCAVELVDGNRFASHILGISKMKFWLLRKLGRIGPKPLKVNGTLEWQLSSILRWIEWDCCNMAEFQAREARAR